MVPRGIRIAAFPLLALAFWHGAATAAGLRYRDGLLAYDAGDFEVAAATFQRLAERGDARSQNDLGFLYLIGQGVPQNSARAAAWFRRAADQGHVGAQIMLGTLYVRGRGVPQARIEAHKWFSLAVRSARNPDRRSVALSRRNALEAEMTPAELDEARRRVRIWHVHPEQAVRR